MKVEIYNPKPHDAARGAYTSEMFVYMSDDGDAANRFSVEMIFPNMEAARFFCIEFMKVLDKWQENHDKWIRGEKK